MKLLWAKFFMPFLVMCGKYNNFYEICCKIGNLF